MVCKRVFLSGRVQGVSFRFHAHEKARELDLIGWVRNLDDGRVEMLVAGSMQAVELMVQWAGTGPSGAEVKNIEILTAKEMPPQKPFYIRRDGGK